MRRSSQFAAGLAALALVSVVGQASAGQARPRSAPPANPSSSSPPPSEQGDRGRSQASRREAPAPAPQSSTQQQPRDNGRNDTRNESRNDARNDPRANGGGRDNRNDNVRGGNGNSGYDTRSAPQRQAVPAPRDRYMDLNNNGRDDRYENRNDNRNDNRYDSRYDSRNDYRDDRYAPSYRYSGPRIVIAPRQPMRFTQSWFSFRPQIRLNIGLTVGYPISFPSWYDPYVVGVPGYNRPYMPYGGVSFDVEPRDAELWVDGDYIGRVSDYSSYDPPLTLVAGRHHVELRGRNYRAIEFDITVVAGQVIPYQGTLPYVR